MIGPLDEGEKCGTIEKVFDVLKNDLGGGFIFLTLFHFSERHFLPPSVLSWRLLCKKNPPHPSSVDSVRYTKLRT